MYDHMILQNRKDRMGIHISAQGQVTSVAGFLQPAAVSRPAEHAKRVLWSLLAQFKSNPGPIIQGQYLTSGLFAQAMQDKACASSVFK